MERCQGAPGNNLLTGAGWLENNWLDLVRRFRDKLVPCECRVKCVRMTPRMMISSSVSYRQGGEGKDKRMSSVLIVRFSGWRGPSILGIWVSEDTDLGFLAKSWEQVWSLSVLCKFSRKPTEESPAIKKVGWLRNQIMSALRALSGILKLGIHGKN